MSKQVFKRMVKVIQCLAILVAITGLAACNNAKRAKADGELAGVGDNMHFYGTDLSPEQEKELLSQRVYYFDYDSNQVKDHDVQSVYAHAKRLIETPRKRVRVEGHTDERGSREYNVALGERRARAIADLLILKGVPQEQISIVSYGKEKPASTGHDESAWSENRRAVIVYEVD